LYLSIGDRCVEYLDGSFVLVAIDRGAENVFVITDRVGGRQCFLDSTPDAFYLASSLTFLAPRDRVLDPVALAAFLVNGFLICGRTLFQDVRRIPRASVSTLSSRGLTSYCYWRYGFDDAYVNRSTESLREELSWLIEQAVQRRARAGEQVVISLSGGYDSPYILDCLRSLGHDSVRCFSYADAPDPGEDDDANVAKRHATQLGYAHEVIPSFSGDAVAAIWANAHYGEARAHFCFEVDAWANLRSRIPSESVILVGDESLGWHDVPLQTTDDVLGSLGLFSSDLLATFRSPFRLDDAMSVFDAERIALASSSFDIDLHKTKDRLYLSERVANVLMPWRELFVARWCRVRSPLLDHRILEFMRHVPSVHRRGKKLFKEVAHHRFPLSYSAPRAVGGFPYRWASALAEHQTRLERWLAAGSAPLAEWIRPRECADMLRFALDGLRAATRLGHQPSSEHILAALLAIRILVLYAFAAQQTESPSSCESS